MKTIRYILTLLLLTFVLNACNSKNPALSSSNFLPEGASDFQDYFLGSGIGDFNYMLSAKVSEAQFEDFARNAGLTEKFSEKAFGSYRSSIDMSFSNKPHWWPNTPIDATAFIKYSPSDERLEYAKYIDGHVYYLRARW